MSHVYRAVALTVVTSLSLVIASCTTTTDTADIGNPDINHTSETEIPGPTSISGYPPESPRMTVRVLGDGDLDNIAVNIVDGTGKVIAGALTMNGVAFFPLDDTVFNPGFHQVIIGHEGNYEVNEATVSTRPTVAEDNESAVAAQDIAIVLTAEEALLLLGPGEDGGVNRVATHTIPSSLAYEFSLHQGQIILISEGEGVEDGRIQIKDMTYSVDGQWVTITTDKANALDVMGNAVKPSDSEKAPKTGIVTGSELQSTEIESKHENDIIAFNLEEYSPVISVTADVEKKVTDQ